MILLPQYITCQNEDLKHRPDFGSLFVQEIIVVNLKQTIFPFAATDQHKFSSPQVLIAIVIGNYNAQMQRCNQACPRVYLHPSLAVNKQPQLQPHFN